MAQLKNLFTGTWSFGSYRNDGVWIPSSSPENPSNNIGETEYIKIDPNKPATFSWAGWSKSIPSDVTIHSYHSNSDLTSYAKVIIDHLSQTAVNNSITFENADGADYIRLYFHGSGSATQYQPLGFAITQAGVFDDVAFKAIVKNDGISDIIMKTIMLKGEAGGTISSIEKTSSVGDVDTYTITLNDGTTSTFEVTNGSNIASIEKTATAGLIDTYTVTLTNGDTSTFEVKNGEDAQLYELPKDCVVGYDKEPELKHAETLENYFYILDNIVGIKSIKCEGITLQDTSPNPDYPKDIYGFGEKQQDGTYTVNFEVIDADDNSYYLTASGLSYPLYAGDRIDFIDGTIVRYNGCVDLGDLSWTYNTNYTYPTFNAGITDMRQSSVIGDIYYKCYKYLAVPVNTQGGASGFSNTPNDLCVCKVRGAYNTIMVQDSDYTDATAFKNAQAGNYFVYELATPTEETVTITGDVEIVKSMRDWTVEFRRLSQYGSGIKVDYYADTDFPDGYEEIDFPLDDLFYYQDQEFIEFPTSWGFVMGYVFDASEIRFTMNVTKDLKQGMSLVANKSVDLALNLYTGAGGSNLTGFNYVDASFIREYGQIQIRLKTENPHGLALGSLLGARVSQGRLRITFEEEE